MSGLINEKVVVIYRSEIYAAAEAATPFYNGEKITAEHVANLMAAVGNMLGALIRNPGAQIVLLDVRTIQNVMAKNEEVSNAVGRD